jgi:hypothetical protein
MVDSGASVSVADGNSVKSLGVSTVMMTCDGVLRQVELQVIDDFKYSLLIGLDVLAEKWSSPSDHLDQSQSSELLKVLEEFNDVFVDKAEECIGHIANVEPMKITLTDERPIFIPQEAD